MITEIEDLIKSTEALLKSSSPTSKRHKDTGSHYTSRNADKFVARMTDTMRNEIAEQASREFISVNSWILQALAEMFDPNRRQETKLAALVEAFKSKHSGLGETASALLQAPVVEHRVYSVSDATKFVIRLPQGMREDINKEAARRSFSMNSLIAMALAEKLCRDLWQEKLIDALVEGKGL